MEIGQWLKVSSDRLKRLGIEPVTGLKDRRFIYYIIASSILGFKEDITFIKGSAYNALNVSNTVYLFVHIYQILHQNKHHFHIHGLQNFLLGMLYSWYTKRDVE